LTKKPKVSAPIPTLRWNGEKSKTA
jgi:hypothetical protein